MTAWCNAYPEFVSGFIYVYVHMDVSVYAVRESNTLHTNKVNNSSRALSNNQFVFVIIMSRVKRQNRMYRNIVYFLFFFNVKRVLSMV